MLRKAFLILPVSALVFAVGLATLHFDLPVGPIILILGFLPLIVLTISGRRVSRAIPDLVFGVVDTGLLTIPALAGGLAYGVPGAVAGGVIGDAITDSIAGLFEGAVAEWLRARGYDESREAVTTSLGKMAGCLFGSGLVLSVALAAGIAL